MSFRPKNLKTTKSNEAHITIEEVKGMLEAGKAAARPKSVASSMTVQEMIFHLESQGYAVTAPSQRGVGWATANPQAHISSNKP